MSMDRRSPGGVQGLLSGEIWRIAGFAVVLPALVGACGSGDSATEVEATGSGSSASASAGGQGGSGATGTGSGASAGGSTGAGGAPGAWCAPIPACDTPPPNPGPAEDWKQTLTEFIVFGATANHRGRDLFLNPGDPQWIIGKFTYGITDKDLKGEDVDIYLLRDCGAAWEKLGTATTTDKDGEHPTVEGVDDSGGRIYFQVPPNKPLGLGRHRVRLVVKGDLSTADLFIEVVPQKTPVFVSDVDGTLTTTETEEFEKLLTGALPGVHADAAKAFKILVKKGYHPLYLTARPEWLVARTREFLKTYDFPPGIVHTTLTLTGHTGDSAGAFKSNELARVALKGMTPAFGFGNTASDADAYQNAHISPLNERFFYQFDDAEHGGRRIESYTDLLDQFEALPSLCP
jgi:hypothetical protein